eukprot:Filipodium_phascolosomae@DN1080_c0_g1_i1.p1
MARNNRDFDVRNILLILIFTAYTAVIFTSQLSGLGGWRSSVLGHWGVWALPAGLLMWSMVTSETIGSSNLYDNLRFLFWSMLPVWMIHNFEQHGFDFKSRHFQWAGWVNATAFGCSSGVGCPVTPETVWMIYGLNVYWNVVLCLLLMKHIPAATAVNLGILVVNAVTPVLAAAIDVNYNPGLVSAIFLLVPLCAWTLYELYNTGGATPLALGVYIGIGILYQGLLIAALSLYHKNHVNKEVLWCMILGLNCTPAIFGAAVKSMDLKDFYLRV